MTYAPSVSIPHLLATIGVAIVHVYLLPRFVSGREPAASTLLMGLGFVSVLATGGSVAINPRADPGAWKVISDLCGALKLFGLGLRIDQHSSHKRWITTARPLATRTQRHPVILGSLMTADNPVTLDHLGRLA